MPTDACWDIYSTEDLVIDPGCAATIHTGICIAVPTGYYYSIEARSGLLFIDDIRPGRGCIDATYTGEILVRALNSGKNSYKVKEGDRVAQISFHKVHEPEFTVVEEFSTNGRGDAGFGSTGK